MPDTKTIFTLLLSLVWLGTGHLLNKRWIKGLLLSVLHGFVLFLGLPALLHALRLLITLGETPGTRPLYLSADSRFNRLLGTTAFSGRLFGLYCRCGAHFRGQIQKRNQKSSVIPIVFLVPTVLFGIFISLLPILFGFSLAFTDYDLHHSPPARLVSWVGGMRNFRDFFSPSPAGVQPL